MRDYVDKLEVEKKQLWNEYTSKMDQESKMIDQRDVLIEEVNNLKQDKAVLGAKVDSEETDIKSLQFNLQKVTGFYQETAQNYKDVVALDKQRAADFNELLTDYKSVCARTNQPIQAPDFESQLTGDAAREFAHPTDTAAAAPPPPRNSTSTIIDHGDGVYSVIGN